MFSSESSIMFWLLASSCFVGLVGAFVIRVSEGSRCHTACTWLFHACLLIVGLTVVVYLRAPSGLGLYAGMTLGVMMIGTTCDFRHQASATAS